ncbi:MAG: hypothetical protein ACI9W1_002313 [Candidatus Azotimanducaceae bacterium]|jgi:hypothetical protein
MDREEIRERFLPAIEEIVNASGVDEKFFDKERFHVYVVTVWGNAVLEPERSGITEHDLPALHDFLNEEIESLLGKGHTVTRCYEYLTSKAGEDAMTRLQVNQQHRDFVHYFARLILGSDALSNFNLRE